MKPTLKYYKKLSEDYKKLFSRSMKLSRKILHDSKRHNLINNLFIVVFFILGFLWGLSIAKGFS